MSEKPGHYSSSGEPWKDDRPSFGDMKIVVQAQERAALKAEVEKLRTALGEAREALNHYAAEPYSGAVAEKALSRIDAVMMGEKQGG